MTAPTNEPAIDAGALALATAAADFTRLKTDAAGLVPAVVQDATDGEVLMVAYMDAEAFGRTITTGRATFFSRSRNSYWVKGETSGNASWVQRVQLDCDNDTVLVRVRQDGPACHTGSRTCFDDRDVPVVVTDPRASARPQPPAGGPAVPDAETFRALASSHRVIPVTRTFMGDGWTPISLYRRLAGNRPGTFLLESAEPSRQWGRYSFIGVRSPARLVDDNGRARWHGTVPAALPRTGATLDVLRATLDLLHTARLPGLPTLTGGMVGFLGYDVVRRLERLPDANPDRLGTPEVALLLATDLAILDHETATITLVANAINWDDTDARVDEARADAVARLDAMQAQLESTAGGAEPLLPALGTGFADPWPDVVRDTTADDYRTAVERAKEHIRAGDAFQIVLSQRFSVPCPADALEVYRVLRAQNPSPYMYLLRFDDVEVVGSSPEALVKVTGGRAMTHPIAGTRPRSADPAEDHRHGVELLADAKERAEHLMLVDLGRNDLGRVCAPGTVTVADFMSVRRYSHVMHLESTVVGEVGAGRTALDTLLACFPAGTLSGAPKVRAMEIIDDLESTRRGVYGGVVGYLDFAGDLDAAIAIRTAVIRDDLEHGGRTAYVQAGAGIVADSDPAAEEAECRHKAGSALAAVVTANRGTVRASGSGRHSGSV